MSSEWSKVVVDGRAASSVAFVEYAPLIHSPSNGINLHCLYDTMARGVYAYNNR